MAYRAEVTGNGSGGRQLGAVALAVIETQRVALMARITGDGQAGGGIHPPRQHDHGLVLPAHRPQ